MWPHFSNFLGTTWTNVLNSLSTSTLSVVLFSLASPVLVFIITIFIAAKKNPERGWMDHAKESIMPTLIGLAVPMVLLAVVFGWKFISSGYYDHQNIAGRWKAVVNEKNSLKGLLSDRDQYIGRLQAQLSEKPSVVEKTKVVPQARNCWTDTVTTYTNPQTKHAVAVITVHCNYRVDAPLRVTLETNRPLANYQFTYPSEGPMGLIGQVSGTLPGKGLGEDKTVFIDLQAPSFSAERMVVFYLESMTTDAPIPIKGTITSK